MTTLSGMTHEPWVKEYSSAATDVAAVREFTPARWALVPLVAVTVAIVLLSCQLRLSLASALPWQCDEIPLLVRFTGLCGQATNEIEAQAFEPSLYSFRTGALRSVWVPKHFASLHTTTGFWANLGLHLFGYGPIAARTGSLFWSFVTVVAVAWATWLATRRISGVCLAVLLVSLTPMIVAYAGQARGYSESIAVTMLLLIALEYLRRRPRSLVIAGAVFVLAFQLSLTVYTMWVYLVLPMMIYATARLPRRAALSKDRRSLRQVLGLITIALIVVMALYTAERWKQLATAPGTFGIPIESFSDVTWFVSRFASQASPIGVVALLFALIGLLVVRRSDWSWWIYPLALSILVAVGLASLAGSPGYVRNFTYLVGPLAVLTACGVLWLICVIERRLGPVAAQTGVILVVSVVGSGAYAGLEARARTILLPDWGALVQELKDEPETVGPRYFCPCIANHWQIDWYAPVQAQRLLDAPPDSTIEFAVGVQRNEQGRRVVFRGDPSSVGLPESPVPAFLDSIAPTNDRYGIEVRRFVGSRVAVGEIADLAPESPILIMTVLASKPGAQPWNRLLSAGDVRDAGIIRFAEQQTPQGLVQTMLTPAHTVATLAMTLESELGASVNKTAFYRLTPITAPRSAQQAVAQAMGPNERTYQSR